MEEISKAAVDRLESPPFLLNITQGPPERELRLAAQDQKDRERILSVIRLHIPPSYLCSSSLTIDHHEFGRRDLPCLYFKKKET